MHIIHKNEKDCQRERIITCFVRGEISYLNDAITKQKEGSTTQQHTSLFLIYIVYYSSIRYMRHRISQGTGEIMSDILNIGYAGFYACWR